MKHSIFKIRTIYPKDKEYSSTAFHLNSPSSKVMDNTKNNQDSSTLENALESVIRAAKNMTAEG